jgi:Flp pilus assembly pilin Flp
MHDIFAFAGRFLRGDSGQDLLEYGLLATLIAITAFAAISSVGTTIHTVLWQLIVAQNV